MNNDEKLLLNSFIKKLNLQEVSELEQSLKQIKNDAKNLFKDFSNKQTQESLEVIFHFYGNNLIENYEAKNLIIKSFINILLENKISNDEKILLLDKLLTFNHTKKNNTHQSQYDLFHNIFCNINTHYFICTNDDFFNKLLLNFNDYLIHYFKYKTTFPMIPKHFHFNTETKESNFEKIISFISDKCIDFNYHPFINLTSNIIFDPEFHSFYNKTKDNKNFVSFLYSIYLNPHISNADLFNLEEKNKIDFSSNLSTLIFSNYYFEKLPTFRYPHLFKKTDSKEIFKAILGLSNNKLEEFILLVSDNFKLNSDFKKFLDNLNKQEINDKIKKIQIIINKNYLNHQILDNLSLNQPTLKNKI